jgi:hypothetical protein
MSRLRSGIAGGIAACAWAVAEPLDRKVLGVDYSDPALLGKAFTRGKAWPAVGLALHAANGVVFGLVFEQTRRRVPVRPRPFALALALAENAALFPLMALTDRYHPARGEHYLAPAFSARGFVQATWRHALFGVVFGRLAAGRGSAD